MFWDDYPRCKIWLAKQFVMKDLGESFYVLSIQILEIRITSTWYSPKLLVKVFARYVMRNFMRGMLTSVHEVDLS